MPAIAVSTWPPSLIEFFAEGWPTLFGLPHEEGDIGFIYRRDGQRHSCWIPGSTRVDTLLKEFGLEGVGHVNAKPQFVVADGENIGRVDFSTNIPMGRQWIPPLVVPDKWPPSLRALVTAAWPCLFSLPYNRGDVGVIAQGCRQACQEQEPCTHQKSIISIHWFRLQEWLSIRKEFTGGFLVPPFGKYDLNLVVYNEEQVGWFEMDLDEDEE